MSRDEHGTRAVLIGRVALICVLAILALAAGGRAAEGTRMNACRTDCQKDYEACWRGAVTYEGYMACYRHASACIEGCTRR